jgi:hypothetical protein
MSARISPGLIDDNIVMLMEIVGADKAGDTGSNDSNSHVVGTTVYRSFVQISDTKLADGMHFDKVW